jgi:tripartite-type tricarboxylate transporter receptor subunit TctC
MRDTFRSVALVRLWLSLLIAGLILAVVPDRGRADDAFPSRTVRIIVPFPAGSGTNILARILAAELTAKWGVSVYVDSVSGASGNIGSAEVARAAPDGYTLLICPPGPIATNGFLFKEMGYDPARWVVISWLASVPYVLDVRPGLADNFQDFLKLARTAPGKISNAMPGAGGTAQLSARLLEMLTGIKLFEVPYRGLSLAMNDVLGGHVDSMFDTLSTSLPLHRAGKIKILAVGSQQRVATLPEVPTIAESGYPTYRSITWFGLVAPPGTPDAVADKINRDVAEILHSPEGAAHVRDIQMEPVGSTRAEAAKFFAEEAVQWGRVIKDANITLE